MAESLCDASRPSFAGNSNPSLLCGQGWAGFRFALSRCFSSQCDTEGFHHEGGPASQAAGDVGGSHQGVRGRVAGVSH